MTHPFPARLIVIVDRAYAGSDVRWSALLDATARAAEGRAVAIQARARDVDAAEGALLAARARAIVPRTVPLVLNMAIGATAVAEALGYDGVHWPEAAIPDAPGPPPASPLRWRTAAVHSPEATRRAAAAGADLVIFGAVYAPGSKPGAGAGLEALRAVVDVRATPVFALGGVVPERVAACLAAGAVGIATISGVLGADDIPATIDRYCAALNAASERSRA